MSLEGVRMLRFTGSRRLRCLIAHRLPPVVASSLPPPKLLIASDVRPPRVWRPRLSTSSRARSSYWYTRNYISNITFKPTRTRKLPPNTVLPYVVIVFLVTEATPVAAVRGPHPSVPVIGQMLSQSQRLKVASPQMPRQSCG